MQSDNLQTTACYLCGERFNYLPELANQVVECPKCSQRIKIFVPPAFDPSLAAPPTSGRSKVIISVFFLLFVATIFMSPWIYSADDGTTELRRYHPIFWPQNLAPAHVRLDAETLLLEWLGLAIGFAAVNMLVGNGREPTAEKAKAHVNPNSTALALAIVGLLATSAVIGISRSSRMAERNIKALVSLKSAVSELDDKLAEIDLEVLGTSNTRSPRPDASIRDILGQIQRDLRIRR